MSATRTPRTLFFAIVFAAIVQAGHDFPLLPNRLASHFDAAGAPNGWMDKSQFFMIYAVMLVPALAPSKWMISEAGCTTVR